jgi:hypothetical protein
LKRTWQLHQKLEILAKCECHLTNVKKLLHAQIFVHMVIIVLENRIMEDLAPFYVIKTALEMLIFLHSHMSIGFLPRQKMKLISVQVPVDKMLIIF